MVDKKPVPAVKPAKQVTLKLVSRPVATVAVNDVEIGQTPIVYSAVQGEGKVRVTFTKKGFVSVTQEVSLERSEEVNIALHRKKAARQKRDSKPPF